MLSITQNHWDKVFLFVLWLTFDVPPQPHVTTKMDDARLAKQLEQAEAENRQVAGDDDDEDDSGEEDEEEEEGKEKEDKPVVNGEETPVAEPWDPV